MPRRTSGRLFPIEQAILLAALRLTEDGEREFHGYELVARAGSGNGLPSVGPGTIYRALQRLEDDLGFLAGRWEPAREARAARRPARRYYHLTASGTLAAEEQLPKVASALGSGPEWSPA